MSEVPRTHVAASGDQRCAARHAAAAAFRAARHVPHEANPSVCIEARENRKRIHALLPKNRSSHSKLESTVRYLGIAVDDALEISEQTEI